MGERFAGKTQLFIALNEGKRFETVPSIRNNCCTKSINKRKYRVTDYCGDNISKEDVLAKLD